MSNGRQHSGETVLITGGAGFIGSHIADALVDENDVRVFDDLSSGSRSNVPDGATLIVGDIRNDDDLAAAAAGVDVIFHEAALISVAESVQDPQPTHDVNVSGTVNVLEAARTEDARVVFASSAAVYGHPEDVPISEDATTDPTSPYGLSKLAGEQYLELYNELYGISGVVLRYFNAYGPGQTSGEYSGVIDVFVEQASTGEPITIDGDGSQTRDFVHVQDIVQANLLAAAGDVDRAVFNVGTGTSVSILELAETVRDVVRSDSEIVHREGRDGDITRSLADVSRLESMGYELTVTLAEGLESVTRDDSSNERHGPGER